MTKRPKTQRGLLEERLKNMGKSVEFRREIASVLEAEREKTW